MPATIGVLAEDRYLVQAQPCGVIAALAARGVETVLIGVAGTGLGDTNGCDLVLVRGRSDALLDRLAQIETCGVPTLNRRAAIECVLDKSVMHRRLEAAGIPVPDTWAGSFDDVRVMLQDDPGPLVVKPIHGDNGRDVVLLPDGGALGALRWQEPGAIVQRYLPNDGCDIKLYCAGDRVWTVRKPSPVHSVTAPASLLVTTDEHRDLAARCAAATGLELFGVDCIGRAGDGAAAELVVIEVNDFPNYSGIPGADEALAGHVLGAVLELAGAA